MEGLSGRDGHRRNNIVCSTGATSKLTTTTIVRAGHPGKNNQTSR